MITLLPTKFYFPPLPSGFVKRPQLLEKLDEALFHRLTLVSAPPGAGKTLLVSAWVQSARKKGISFGWLCLDSADNEMNRLLGYLGACLEEGGTVIDLEASSMSEGKTGQLEDILAQFIQGLMGIEQEIVLILDDYHVIQNQQVHSAVQYILDHAPNHLHLVILTRSDPPWSFLVCASQVSWVRSAWNTCDSRLRKLEHCLRMPPECGFQKRRLPP